MSGFKSDFLRVLSERGFINQCTDQVALDERAAKGPITAYIGFDCTADSLHAGSLLPIMMLRRLQQTGHRPVVLLGGGTTKVGDPSGKDESRKMLSDDQIAANKAGIRKVFDKYLTFGDGPTDAVMVDNDDWLSGLGYISFLRDFGPHFTINRMMGFDSVKLRLERERPLTFLEFNYMILQAYDFVELRKRIGCVLQMGGSDQWGNIVNGVELGRRVAGYELFGLTTALLTTSSGAKMGKTAAGAVWLSADMFGPYDFYQYFRNTEDGDVGRFLRLFTDLPMDEIARLERLEGAGINKAKKILAHAVTALAHGTAAADEAAETARRVFETGAAAEGLPTIEVPADALAGGIAHVDLFVQAGLAASKGEARRLIKQGGLRLNDKSVTDEAGEATTADLVDGVIKLSAGKKRHVLVRGV